MSRSDDDGMTAEQPVARGEVRIYTIRGDRGAARAVRTRILAASAGVPIESLVIERGEKGKPSVANDTSFHFSASHSGDVSMIAVTRVGAVGIDVERVRAVPHAELMLRRFFSEEEVASILSSDDREFRFIRLWTRGEATVKVRGASVWEVATPDPTVTVQAVDAPDGYAASVAVRASAPWHVTQMTYELPIVPGAPPAAT